MLKMDKITSALVLLTLCIFAFSGCVNNTGDTTKPQETNGIAAKEVLDRSFSASASAGSYSYKMVMKASMPDSIAGGAAMEVMSAAGKVDKANKKMHLSTVMNPLQSSKNTETYIIGNTYYGRLSTGEWIRQETNGDDLWTKESMQGVQSELINSSAVSFLPEENLNGADCYVLNITPDKDKLPELLGKSADIQEQTVDNIISASINEWVDKDSGYMKRVLFQVDMNDSGKVIRMETDITFYDYGANQAIELPQEAKNAQTVEMQSAKKPTEEELLELEG